jgi:hypothetical protein
MVTQMLRQGDAEVFKLRPPDLDEIRLSQV